MSEETAEHYVRDYILPYSTNLLAASLIFLVGWAFARTFRYALRSLMRRVHLDEILVGFFSNITYVLVLAFVVIAALNKLGVQTASLVAMIGAAGLAIGLALQGSLSNFAAGIMIIIFRHFKIGDYVQTGGGVAGNVREMSIFTTTLMTPTNERVIVPNSKFTGDVLTNFTAMDYRRIDVQVGIGYGDDIAHAKGVIGEVIRSRPLMQEEPAPFIGVAALGDSAVMISVQVWVPRTQHGNERAALLEAIKLAFDREGISLPYPQRDVHLVQAEQTPPPPAAKKKKAA